MRCTKHIVLSWLLVITICFGFSAHSYLINMDNTVKICLEDSTDEQQSDEKLANYTDLFFQYTSQNSLSNIKLLTPKLSVNESIALPLWCHSPLTPPPDLA